MTFTRHGLFPAVIVAAIALGQADALAQTAAPSHEHDSRASIAGPQAGNMAARLASLDERIAMLMADMKMFSGELKIQTMAALLEALVERQTLVDAEMKRMHEHMGGAMNDRRRHAPPPSTPEPETLCSPFI